MQLRPYQLEAVDAVFREWDKGVQSTLLVLPTGLGKTICFAEIIRRMQPRRCKVLAHREELIFQARDKIQRVTGLDCDIEMADLIAPCHGLFRAPVVVSTVQTQIAGRERKRMHRFNPLDFGLVIIDEAHRSAAESYLRILEHYKQNPNIKILGVTATPERADEESLGKVFKTIAYQIGIFEAIQQGWLVNIAQQFIGVEGLDYSHIKTKLGDLDGRELAEVMEQESNIAGVCHPTLEVIYGLETKTLTAMPVTEWTAYLQSLGRQPRRTIVFTASVKQAEMCCNIFNRAMPNLAAWVSGKTPKEERRQTLDKFQKGATGVLCNVGVVSEGYDNPACEIIVMAAATKSRVRYCQQIGRGTRPLPGVVDGLDLETPEKRLAAIAVSAKPVVRVLDFSGNSGRHKLMTCMDVLSGNLDPDTVERAIRRAKESGRAKLVTVCLQNAEQQKKWEEEQAKRKAARLAEEARKLKMVPKAHCKITDVSPFDESQWFSGQKKFKKKKAFTPRQDAYLRRHCGKDPSTLTYWQGVTLIAEDMKRRGWDKKKAA